MSWQYDNYLKNHIRNVGSAYQWLYDNLPVVIPEEMGICIQWHDQSKYDKEEYEAYDAFFYGRNKSYEVVNNFNYAWLHHIHHNPHHWQHWVLKLDDGGDVALEMPKKYIIEMICDWWSFSFAKGDLYEIFSWYEAHKPTMKLHKNTMNMVEYILDMIHKKLDEEKENR